MAERWSINIYFVWKTTIVPLSVCRAFFSYNPYLRDKSHSFLLTGRYFVKNAYISIFSQKGRRLEYKLLCRIKDHYSHLEFMASFFSCNLYLRQKSHSSLSQQGKFRSKIHDKSNFFSKRRNGWGINIYFVWNTTIVPLSVCRAFLFTMCICVTNHVPFLLTGRYFVKNAYICNFFSKSRNAGV